MWQFPKDSVCPPADDEYDEDFFSEVCQAVEFRRGKTHREITGQIFK